MTIYHLAAVVAMMVNGMRVEPLSEQQPSQKQVHEIAQMFTNYPILSPKGNTFLMFFQL